MRFATYRHEGTDRAGLVEGDQVHDLAGVGLLDLIRQGGPALEAAGRLAREAGRSHPLAEVELRAPFQPPTIRDFIAFEEHVAGTRPDGAVPDAWAEAPAFYFTNPYAVVGPYDDVPVPPGCRLLDFELEVAAVVGKAGHDLTVEQARDHIVGYLVMNDWSARDLQGREMQVHLGPAKGKDFATTLGPWLVTADELEPYRDADGFLRLAMTAEVNGAEVGCDLLSNMSWTFEELLVRASRGTWVRPGDVIGSGTCGNGGCLLELWTRNGIRQPPPLAPGDTVALTVEGIGRTSNTVVPGVEPQPLPTARSRPHTRPS